MYANSFRQLHLCSYETWVVTTTTQQTRGAEKVNATWELRRDDEDDDEYDMLLAMMKMRRKSYSKHSSVCLKKSQSSSVNLKCVYVNNWSILTTVCTAECSTSVKLSVLFSCMRFKKLQLFVEMCSMWINHSTFQFHVSSATLYYWNKNFCGEMRKKLEEVNKCFACSHRRRRWKHRKM